MYLLFVFLTKLPNFYPIILLNSIKWYSYIYGLEWFGKIYLLQSLSFSQNLSNGDLRKMLESYKTERNISTLYYLIFEGYLINKKVLYTNYYASIIFFVIDF